MCPLPNLFFQRIDSLSIVFGRAFAGAAMNHLIDSYPKFLRIPKGVMSGTLCDYSQKNIGGGLRGFKVTRHQHRSNDRLLRALNLASPSHARGHSVDGVPRKCARWGPLVSGDGSVEESRVHPVTSEEAS